MDNQHRKIKGYRDLSQEEVDLMNEIKEKGMELDVLVRKLQDLNRVELTTDDPVDIRVAKREASRWVAIGKTHLQQGLMALTRAVAKPGFF